MAPVRAVVFDYGDTLGSLAVAEQRLLEAYGEIRGMLVAQADHDIPEAADLMQKLTGRIIGLVNESYQRRELEELDILALFEETLGSLGFAVPRDAVQRIVELEYRAIVSERTIPPENLDTLEQLKHRGLKLGLVSNAHFLPALLLEDFDRLGIARYMDAIVTSSQVGLRKPHPDIFRRILGVLGVEPQEAVFVGDKLREDVYGPKELGMRAVLTRQFRSEDVDPAKGTPDAVIDSLAELLPYLAGLVEEAPAKTQAARE
jgi:putative hydrolase of the HAD superfamily